MNLLTYLPYVLTFLAGMLVAGVALVGIIIALDPGPPAKRKPREHSAGFYGESL